MRYRAGTESGVIARALPSLGVAHGSLPARVVSQTNVLQRKCDCGSEDACGPCKEKEGGVLQRSASAGSSVQAVPPIVHEVLGSSGQPLDAETRAFFEPRFGRDFSGIRVHTGAGPAASALAVHANAYTVGSEIVFAQDRFVPHTVPGRRLIAHELAHTIQQTGTGGVGRFAGQPLSIAAPGDSAEREADRAADAVTRAGIGSVEVSLSVPAEPIAQRESTQGSKGDKKAPVPANAPSPTGSGVPAAPGPTLDVEFDAFIPGFLGSSFEKYPHPTNLKNQTTFEADLKAVKGSWLKEPGSIATPGSGPWYFATDNRSFGGGSHRLGFAGKVPRADIGSLDRKPPLFTHTTSGSEHVHWQHTGDYSSNNETGSVDRPFAKSASPSSSEAHADSGVDESTVTTKGSANYPFKALSPDIDYTVAFELKRETGGRTRLRFTITKNLFPFYELLINGRAVWKYTAPDPGPTVSNLTKTDKFRSGDWFF
jgi:hypothetical protein